MIKSNRKFAPNMHWTPNQMFCNKIKRKWNVQGYILLNCIVAGLQSTFRKWLAALITVTKTIGKILCRLIDFVSNANFAIRFFPIRSQLVLVCFVNVCAVIHNKRSTMLAKHMPNISWNFVQSKHVDSHIFMIETSKMIHKEW